jgi:UDPglucose 6-dehydrogenase
MKVAFVGLGKLGFPCALAAASRGHSVVGYDISPTAKEILTSRMYPHREVGAQEMLETTTLRIVDTVDEAVIHADLVLIAVQTPHQPEFEGVTRMPCVRRDFDYTALRAAVKAAADSALRLKKPIVIDVISTVLPGTCEREVYPLLNEYARFAYSPYFIAMGATIPDFLNPEFTLIGFDPSSRAAALQMVHDFYRSIHSAPLQVMSVKSAELAKVAYNVFLGLKIVAANTVMEIAHKVGADADEVMGALALATDRVVSAKYMRGGMGDGGPCHPRDQIALSHLARELRLSYDLFAAMVRAREAQTEWIADLCYAEARARGLPIVVLGKAYKKGTNLTVGSPATLLRNILAEPQYGNVSVQQFDPHVDGALPELTASVFVIATDHDEFFRTRYPCGSIIIDPWGKMPEQDEAKVTASRRRRAARAGPKTRDRRCLRASCAGGASCARVTRTRAGRRGTGLGRIRRRAKFSASAFRPANEPLVLWRLRHVARQSALPPPRGSYRAHTQPPPGRPEPPGSRWPIPP